MGTIGINQGTNLGVAADSIGGTYYGIGKIDISPIGASGTLFNGTVGISALPNTPGGTINLATVQVAGGTVSVNELSGTINLGTITGNVGMSSGTLNVATISALPNLPQGSINVTAGTINAGTITDGTLQNLNFGTIALSDGTTKANVMASGVSNGTGAQNAQLMAGGFAEFSGSATAGTTDIVAAIDVSAYKWLSLQLYGTYAGTVNISVSNDNNTWLNEALNKIDNTQNVNLTILTANDIYHGPVIARYLRVRTTNITSGTMQGVLELYTNSSFLQTYGVAAAQIGAWNVGGTVFNQALTAFGTFLGTTGAVTGTTIMGTTTGLGTYRSMNMFANLQGAGGTAKTDIYLQTSPDGGVTWVDYAHYTQLAASATSLTAFTTSKGANAQQAAGLYTVGTGNVPALGAGSIIGGDWGDRLRYIAAISTGGTNAGTCTFNIALTT